jgi:hypothetical protein
LDALKADGHCFVELKLPEEVKRSVEARDWAKLDAEIARETKSGGVIFRALSEFSKFTEIEFIIAIRSSEIAPDDDGIWHDDGSRCLAFSLSLTLDPSMLEGGRLQIRKLPSTVEPPGIPTPPFGTMIVFATGQAGFEHRILRVSQGERVIIAGWCT